MATRPVPEAVTPPRYPPTHEHRRAPGREGPTMTTNAELRLRWFDAGAEAAGRVTGGALVGRYTCPLCRGAFLNVGVEDGSVLSLEDVPPKKLTGKRRPLVLTCKRCNNDQGSSLDAHAVRMSRAQRLLGGHLAPGERVAAYMPHAGHRIPVDLKHGSGGEMLVTIHANRAPPGAVDGFMNSLVEMSGPEPHELHFQTAEGFRVKSAGLSWVRAAYLAAFAVFGYRWMLIHSALEQLRRQLHDPGADIVNVPILRDENEDEDARRIFLVDEPHDLAGSIAVILGTRAVVLPGEAFGWTFERTSEILHRDGGEGGRITGSVGFSWPTEARYGQDGEGGQIFVVTGDPDEKTPW